MRFKLSFPDYVEPCQAVSKTINSVDDLLIFTCGCLGEMPSVIFEVEAFGLDWNVDVGMDLSSVIPQVFSFIKNIDERKNSELQFFEQGVERLIRVYPADNRADCLSLIGQHFIAGGHVDLILMRRNLIELVADFNRLSGLAISGWDDNKFAKEWKLEIKSYI